MRWKILWLITTLALTSHIEGARVNVEKFLSLDFKSSTPKPHTELNVSQTYGDNEKIQELNSIANEADGVSVGNKTELENILTNNNNKNGINQSERTATYQDNSITTGTVVGNKNVTTSLITGLLRIAGEKISESVSHNVGRAIVSLQKDQKDVEVGDEEGDTTNGRWQREVADEAAAEVDEPTPIKTIDTEHGQVEGFAWENTEEIIGYFDIPYGQFTSFEEPVHPDKWVTVHSANKHTKRCPQITDDNAFSGGTDCLTLNVFTPREATDASVFFYIHESGSNVGSGDPFLYGPKYLVKKGIILVLPNYRIGTLGFLCLRNSTAPGNAALKDLALALEWTKKNIKAFGGNPSNIVVSGDGSAGALAGYLALSSGSKEHISRVISESGAVLSHWAIDRTPINTGTQVAERIRSLTDNYADNVFSEISIEDLVKTTRSFSLKPCIEGNSNGTITKNPWTMLNTEAMNKSFIIGSANHAALRTALRYDDEAISQLNEDFGSALPNDLGFPNVNTRNDVARRIRAQYFGTGDITSSATKNLSQYHTDVSYLGPDVRLARSLVAAGATVYLYEFSFVGEFNSELQSIDSASHHGATKGDIVGYLFSKKDRNYEDSSKEAKVVDMITNLWVSFIEYGRPAAEGVTWNQFNATDDTLEQWLSIGEEASHESGFHYDRLRLWSEVYRDFFIDRSATTNVKALGYLYYAIALYFIKITKNVFV